MTDAKKKAFMTKYNANRDKDVQERSKQRSDNDDQRKKDGYFSKD